MILPDVNVLVYAFREGAPNHQRYAEWLGGLVRDRTELMLVDHVLVGFVRIVTHGRIMDPPSTPDRALAFVEALRRSGNARRIEDPDSVWRRLRVLADSDPQLRANIVPDAYLAAVALSHNATLASRNRGFARFPGLRWFDPAVRSRAGGQRAEDVALQVGERG